MGMWQIYYTAMTKAEYDAKEKRGEITRPITDSGMLKRQQHVKSNIVDGQARKKVRQDRQKS